MSEIKTYGVFVHSSGPQGGYVVRTMYDGWTPSPYSSELALAVYKREQTAQKKADSLNGALFGRAA